MIHDFPLLEPALTKWSVALTKIHFPEFDQNILIEEHPLRINNDVIMQYCVIFGQIF